MSEYSKWKRRDSRYRPKRSDPYRSLTYDLYRRLLNKYKPKRSSGGSGGYGSRSSYRPSVERYHPAPEYKPRHQERAPSQWVAKREPRAEVPTSKAEPDVEQLLRELEKRLDERLNDRILEVMGREFGEARAEGLRRYTLPESAPDEDVQSKIEQLQDREKQDKEHTLEISQERVDHDNLRLEQEQTQPIEGQSEPLDESLPEPMSEIVEKTDTQTSMDASFDSEVRPTDIPERPPEEAMEPPESAEEIAKMVAEDPVLARDLEPEMLADIEILYNELELELELEEQVEPEEETIEP
jgi:hypothetical protein